jgi:hypothetical protein
MNAKLRDILKIMLTLVIASAPVVVAPAIKLDYEGMRGTKEIDNIGSHRMLTSELDACETPISEQAPEDAFGNRPNRAKLACSQTHEIRG